MKKISPAKTHLIETLMQEVNEMDREQHAALLEEVIYKLTEADLKKLIKQMSCDDEEVVSC